MSQETVGSIGAIVVFGFALLATVVALWPGGVVQTLVTRGRVDNRNGGRTAVPEPHTAQTAAPSIDEERVRREVVELAAQASNREWERGVVQLLRQMHDAGIDPVWKPNGRLKMAAEGQDPVVQIYDLIFNYFSNSEVEELRFALGIPEGSVGGNGKAERIIRLIEYCKNRGRLGELVTVCRARRAHLDWPQVGLDK